MPLSIPLPILIGIIAAGFTVLLLLLTAMGGHQRAALSEAVARDRLRLDFPDQHIQSIALADDQQAALAPIAGSDATALVVVLGDKLATRVLDPRAVRRVSADPQGLWLRLRDPGFPRVRLAVADPDVRARWQARLSTGAARGHP